MNDHTRTNTEPSSSFSKSEEAIAYLDKLSLTQALWWFIENANDEATWRNDVFFHLRARVRQSTSTVAGNTFLSDVLSRAESFITGFEDDETQVGVSELLRDIRGLLPRESSKIDPQPPRPKRKPVCPKCGSDDVSADAAARWDLDTQTWDLTDVSSKGHSCGDCGAENIRFKWVQSTDED